MLGKLHRRADYLAANKGKRQPMPGFVLLKRDRRDDSDAIRLGITITKKVGNAVIRNRMKRRFRELGRALLPERGQPGCDYVLIGRAGGIERDFTLLAAELGKAIGKLDDRKASPPRDSERKGRNRPSEAHKAAPQP